VTEADQYNELIQMKHNLNALRTMFVEQIDAMEARIDRLLPEEDPDPFPGYTIEQRRKYYKRRLEDLR